VGAQEASPEGVPAAAAVASQAVAVEAAEVVDQLRWSIEEEDLLILFFLSCR
jgi:hypothetical protein